MLCGPHTGALYTQLGVSVDAGSQLVLQTFAGKAALPSEAALAFDFRPRQWYHVVVAHAPGGPLSAPLATLYVNGQPVAAAEKLRYPKVRAACVAILGVFVCSAQSPVMLAGLG